MFPGMAWELDTQSRRIALDEAVRDGQQYREAMAARSEQQDRPASRRSWLDRLTGQLAAWMSTGAPAGRGTTSPSAH